MSRYIFKKKSAIAILLLLSLAGWQLGRAGYIQAKAILAQYLIADAWEQTLATGEQDIHPWTWADTWPVARLQVPALTIDQYVLAGGNGQALAFGPGMISSVTASSKIISAHRDTHFRFLKDLKPGDQLRLQNARGQWQVYKVKDATVVDTRIRQLQPPADNALILITCFPFDALTTGGPLRYLVNLAPA